MKWYFFLEKQKWTTTKINDFIVLFNKNLPQLSKFLFCDIPNISHMLVIKISKVWILSKDKQYITQGH